MTLANGMKTPIGHWLIYWPWMLFAYCVLLNGPLFIIIDTLINKICLNKPCKAEWIYLFITEPNEKERGIQVILLTFYIIVI